MKKNLDTLPASGNPAEPKVRNKKAKSATKVISE